jgi:hypothetical protein
VAKNAGIERRGHYAPKTWKAFDTVTSLRMEASDHHTVWVDLEIWGTYMPTSCPITRAWLRLYPDFDPLRGDPRFEELASTTPKTADK